MHQASNMVGRASKLIAAATSTQDVIKAVDHPVRMVVCVCRQFGIAPPCVSKSFYKAVSDYPFTSEAITISLASTSTADGEVWSCLCTRHFGLRFRNILAGFGRLRQRCAGCRVSFTGHRLSGCGFCLRVDGADHGLCCGPYLGRPFQPCRHLWPMGGQAFSAQRIAPYVVAQVLGAILATVVLAAVASGKAGWAGGLPATALACIRRADMMCKPAFSLRPC
jgi:hypothetical protein